jgi:hypothetical protein
MIECPTEYKRDKDRERERKIERERERKRVIERVLGRNSIEREI